MTPPKGPSKLLPGGDGRPRSQQLGQANQVVGRGGEGEGPAHPVEAAMLGLALPGDGLDPGEHLLDAMACPLAVLVAGMAGGAAAERRPVVC